MQLANKLSFNPYPGLRSKTFPVLLFMFCCTYNEIRAQIADDFSDGDMTSNPEWHGSTGSFIINGSSQLQLNATAAGSSSVSFHFPVSPSDQAEWEVYIRQSFAPSGGNFSRYYLMSDQSDLTAPLNGYFLQFGEAGANDAVELFRQSGTVVTSVSRASDAAIASAFALRVRVTRSAESQWQVFVDYAGERNFVLASAGIDDHHPVSSYTGWLCTYTVTNATRFYLDDVYCAVSPGIDTTPPTIMSVNALTSNSIEVNFSEALNQVSAENPSNYSVLESPPDAVSLASDGRTVKLTFATPFVNGSESLLYVKKVQDTSGNSLAPIHTPFLFFEEREVHYRDIVISEIFPDPLPRIRLPVSEFVEVFNRGTHPFQLGGYTLSDGTSLGVCPDYILLPGQYAILCPSSAAIEYQSFGPVLGLPDFPTLNNSGDHVRLTSRDGMIIDSLNYTNEMYHDEDKASGGWSLERINPEDWCNVNKNWTSSINEAGGTPGTQNSVNSTEPDLEGPSLLNVVPVSDTKLRLTFDETLSADTPMKSRVTVEPYIEVLNLVFSDEAYKELLLDLATSLDSMATYRISVYDVFDCPGNPVKEDNNHFYLKQDLTPPNVLAAEIGSTVIRIIFSEALDAASATSLHSYSVDGVGPPEAALLLSDDKGIELEYRDSFTNGVTYRLAISSISDVNGNLLDTTISIVYFKPAPLSHKDVLITEFMADPSPAVGLPEVEFIELFNRSLNPVDLGGWTVGDATQSVKLNPFILLPDAYVVLTNAVTEFAALQNVLKTNIPSLNNAGDIIRISDATGRTIDSLSYSAAWFSNSDAGDGGWSFELIDPENICAGVRNWKVSEAEAGGTPGTVNSVAATLPDNTGPTLLSSLAADSLTLILAFDEKLDHVLPSSSDFSIHPPLDIQHLAFRDESLTELVLRFTETIKEGKMYELQIAGVYDCRGNELRDASRITTFVLPQTAQVGDVVINEILCNPRSTGVDFVEVYNCSEKIIDLIGWTISNPLASGKITFSLEDSNSLLSPGEFRVFTEDPEVLKGEYLSGEQGSFRRVGLPAFNDELGSVVLKNRKGEVIDSAYYSEHMHSAFINDPDGVSLERISYAASAGLVSNWTSASSVVGFATPGYGNSNKRVDASGARSIVVEPEIIQPADYTRSFARINYEFAHGGFICNVKIFDHRGHTIKHLAENELLGTKGFLRWDGDDDNGAAAGTGYYLVWFEIFDARGNVRTFRERVAIF